MNTETEDRLRPVDIRFADSAFPKGALVIALLAGLLSAGVSPMWLYGRPFRMLFVGVGLTVSILTFSMVRNISGRFLARRFRTRLNELGNLMDDDRELSLTDAIQRVGLANLPSCNVDAMEAAMCSMFFTKRYNGYCLRIAGQRSVDLQPIIPLSLPFEPVPLWDDDPNFQEAFGLAVPSAPHTSGNSAAGAALETPSSTPRWNAQRIWRRLKNRYPATPSELSRRMKNSVWIAAVAAAALLGFELFIGKSRHRLTVLVIAVFGSALLACLGGWPDTTSVPQVFPGGIAFPPRPGRRRWWIVRRANGVLFANYTQIGAHIIVGADGHRRDKMVSTFAADVAVAAWLSPLPGPTDDALRSWFGEDAVIVGAASPGRPQGPVPMESIR